MKRTSLNQSGFIPLLLAILLVVLVVIYVVYTRVHNAQQ